MRKITAAFLVLTLFAANPAPALAVYKDEIAVSRDEVWKAVNEVLGKKGLRKSNEKKMTIESRWIVDTIRRRAKLPVLDKLSHEEYERRYRFKISLRDRVGDTEIVIKSVFQVRHINANEAGAWQLIKPTADDLDVEREFFMKILKKIGDARKAASGV